MGPTHRFLLLAATLALSACADWQRTGYETAESYRQQQCWRTMGKDCEKREPYDDYQRKRKEVLEGDKPATK